MIIETLFSTEIETPGHISSGDMSAPSGDSGSFFADTKENEKILFTSESVGEGHPDKMCDQISDAVLDAHLQQDPNAKVACETVTNTGMVMVFGEITSKVNNNVRFMIYDVDYVGLYIVLRNCLTCTKISIKYLNILS